MRNNSHKEALRWIEEAEYELDTAKYLLEGQRYSTVCFHYQQCTEKAIKSFLYSSGKEFVLGHSIVKLCEEAQEIDKDFKDISDEAGSLDGYYIPTRYPNSLPDSIPSKVYNKKNADESLELAEKVIKIVKEKVKTEN